ncbi:hypothetical protein HOD20_06800 [archaeon]|jgi:sucrose phosphorylase|nr:hypothetical protein [archaeon]MBT4352213.1 hypothetical protein [archaeon]MBT4647336.1 hypothetical protein [archaeon]MBT6821228.1 hypothetical protein [archaeon]MBT7391280.1 hypothetical protein [archaeon]
MVENKVGLIAYADRFGSGKIRDFSEIIKEHFNGYFGHIHLLPTIFPHGGKDAGFDCITHLQINQLLSEKKEGKVLDGWEEIKNITGKERNSPGVDVMVDVIINHISSKNLMFQDVLEKGEESKILGFIFT